LGYSLLQIPESSSSFTLQLSDWSIAHARISENWKKFNTDVDVGNIEGFRVQYQFFGLLER
jgi:hypothetical protein